MRPLLYRVAGLVALLPAAAPGSGYEQQRATALRKCEAIDPAAYQSGLLFNPDGYRSYYVQSECFQRIAVEFRDEALCERVVRRRSLFSSSWGYSKQQCRKDVRAGVGADEAELGEQRRRYEQGPLRIEDFAVVRNGNGQDYDIVPVFTGDDSSGYTLRFELLTAGMDGGAVPIHSDGYYLEAGSQIRVFVRQQEIRARLPRFAPGQRHAMRATMIRDVGDGGAGGRWSDAFIERVFPVRDRSQSLDREVRF